MKKPLVALLVVAMIAAPLTGCKTSNSGSWIGAGVGAAGGALLGGIIGHQSGNKWKGALIGAGVGALAGYIVGTELGAESDDGHRRSEVHLKAAKAFDRANRATDPHKAIRLYRKSIEIDPVHPEPYNNMGLIFVKLSERESARLNFEKALQVDPSFQPAADNLERLKRGRM